MSLTNLFGGNTNYSKPNENNSNFIFQIPGPDKPLIVKFLGDPRTRSRFVAMRYYPHSLGPLPTDKRSHPSLRALGVLKDDPEFNVYQSCLKRAKEETDTDIQKALRAKAELFKPKEGGWIHVIEPNSSEIKCLKIGKDVINQLFGRKAYGDKVPEIKSLLASWASEGYDVYNIENNEGWVKIYKTGEGMSTRYVLELDQIEEMRVDEKTGKKFKMTVVCSHEVHEKIRTSDVSLEDFPDPIALETKNAFTEEETIKFVESEGTLVPERFFKKKSSGSASTSNEEVQQTSDVNLDEIPF